MKISCLIAAVVVTASLCAAPLMPPVPPDQITEIVIQNRILAKVNEKTISVLDVVKNMDVFLRDNYPQYMESKTLRYQYYTAQWRQTLQQMVDNELMVADAESREVKVSDGEVREEIQRRFGPNIMQSLDVLNLTYEEARKLVHQEMIVQRMQWFRVMSKAIQKITSQEIKQAYQNYVKENPPKEEVEYQFLTIRGGASQELCSDLANRLIALKTAAQNSLIAAADRFKQENTVDESVSIAVSQEYNVEKKSIAESHREILEKLNIGEWSAPILQTSRDGSSVTRLFYLKNRTQKNPPAFEAVSNDIRQHLLNEVAQQEGQGYLNKLHQRFGYDESSLDIPDDFEPFSVR